MVLILTRKKWVVWMLLLAGGLPAAASAAGAAAPETGKAAAVTLAAPVEEAYLRHRTDIYIQALILVKDFPELKKVLRHSIEATPESDTRRLMRLAQYGMENELNSVAVSAYEKILKHNAGNLPAMRNVGLLLFNDRKYEPAIKFLGEYNRRTGGDYITNYSQGEAMYLTRKSVGEKACVPYLEKAVAEAKRLGGGIKDAEVVRAKSLFRLGREQESFAVFRRLERRYPDDVYILLDFASMLSEAGLLDEACVELRKLPSDLYRPGALARFKLDPKQNEDVTVKVMAIRIAAELKHRNFFTVKRMEDELRQHYPDHPDAALSRAAFYAAYDNWRGDLENVRQALKSYPEDESLALEERRLTRQHGSYIQNQTGVRLSDNNGTEIMVENRAEVRVTDDLRLGINNITDFANLHAVPRMSGAERAFNGTRNQLEVFLQGDLINGDKVKLSLFDQDGVVGTGGSYTLLDFWGNTRLGLAFREPYWGQQQAIAEKGGRTYVELARELRLLDNLTLSGTVSGNSYSLGETMDLASSFAIGAGATYELPHWKWQQWLLGDMSAVTLNYEFDYENFVYHRSNRDGVYMYNPDDRQIHSFFLGVGKEFGFGLRANVTGGYAYDMLGDSSGPIYSAALAYLITEELEISATVSHVISSNKYFYAGFGLKYNFTPRTLLEIYERNLK